MDSILKSIKKMIGPSTQYDNHFDEDLVFHINSVFMILNQLGVGPADGFSISDESSTWSDYLGDDKTLELVKSYMYLKVRLIFDPPMSSAVMDVINRQISEFEWRLNVAVDPSKAEE